VVKQKKEKAMKKIYMAPTTEQVRVNIEQHILAGSPNAAVNKDEEIKEGDFASRGGSWFDDDDEDY
jgi:hypothetical protein